MAISKVTLITFGMPSSGRGRIFVVGWRHVEFGERARAYFQSMRSAELRSPMKQVVLPAL
jgi:hypothetical protein